MRIALFFDAEKSSEGGGIRKKRKRYLSRNAKIIGIPDSSVMHPAHFANIKAYGFIFFTLLKLSGSKNVYDYSTSRRKSGRRLSRL